jgi:iron complex transport system substrate-binding protein
MLKIFMEAAMAANDNKIAMLIRYYAENHIPSPRVLYLNFHQKFSVPTLHSMTGQLLKRLGTLDISLTACQNEDTQKITVAIDRERLLNLNPDCLIVATENNHALEKEMRQDSAFSKLKALRHNKIFFVDEVIQQSPTQYIVLAYHDLIQVLTKQP